MKKYVLLGVAAMLVAFVTLVALEMSNGGNYAYAANAATANVTISSTVAVQCGAISAANLTLAIDPSAGTQANSTGGNTTVQCTKTTPFTVAAAGLNGSTTGVGGTLNGNLSKGSGADIPYALTYTSSFTGAGFGSATPTTLITGTGGAIVTATNVQAAEAGSYSDTVTLTISY